MEGIEKIIPKFFRSDIFPAKLLTVCFKNHWTVAACRVSQLTDTKEETRSRVSGVFGDIRNTYLYVLRATHYLCQLLAEGIYKHTLTNFFALP